MPTSEITLRGYREEDLDAMYALDVACFDPRFRFSRAMMQRFATAAKARVVIAECSGELAGFAIAHVERGEDGAVGYVATLDVAERARRQGLAGELMAALEAQAREAGCEAMTLHVWVGNAAAIRFYEHAGYERNRRARDFYGRALDAWVYRKALTR